ncbi:hypothetical protein PO909_012213 [Leuciscus waleckii]
MKLSLLLDCFISRMLFLGIMSRQKQNLLWLMTVCCASCQITSSQDSKIQVCVTSTNPAVNTTSQSTGEKHQGDFHIYVTLNISLVSGQCKSYNFSIAKHEGEFEVRMNETFKGIKLWLLPKENCTQSLLNFTGACRPEIDTVLVLTSPNPAVDLTSAGFLYMNVTLNISSQGQWKSYNYSITKQERKCKVEMKEFEGIRLCILPDDCLQSTLNVADIFENVNCQTGSTTGHSGCQSISPVDPEESCRYAKYDNDACSGAAGNERSTYVLRLNGSGWTCVTCNNIPNFPTYFDPSKASDTLNNLKTKMEEMEKNNISKEVIVMGDVIGLLHIQAKNTETRDTCYSSDPSNIKVTDCQSDLKTDILWYVKIPSEALNKARLENNGSALFGVLRFKNMGKDETKNYTVLNDEVYGITMRANISNLSNNIEMFFTQKDLVGEASCSSWDGKGNLTWTVVGCETEKINNNTIKCSCSHLTFFAVLMSSPDVNANITAKYVGSLTFITSIGCGISMFFLSVALFMHFLLRKAKSNQATKILMNMFVALFLLNLSFLSNESVANTGDKAACVFIALLMHYSMLTTFTWFFIQALHMYLWLIRQNVTITNYMRKITVFGWTFPAPIVVAVVSIGGYKTITISATSGKTQMCWITDPLIHYIVNIGYYALVFIFTTGIFIMIVTKIVQTRHIRAPDGKRKTFRKQLMMVLSLFLLFGLTWAVAFFSYGEMLIPSYYIFTVLNSFQGFFLFLYYYNIHKDIEGNFSDDPERSGSTTTIVQSNAVENVYN